jgi:tetratricopeptide (TPR) repeat protein
VVRRVRPARGLWLLVWAVATGCAAHGPRATSNPFVTPGKPTLEIGEPLAVAKPLKAAKGSDGSSHPAAKLRPVSNLLPTIESRDPLLSAALLRLAIAPTAEAHRAVGDRYRVLGILDMAYDHYLRASQIDRTDSAAYEGLARVWRDWGFPDLGAPDASRAVFYAPLSASAHNTWGTVLTATGHRADARREYERAVALDPDAAYAWSNLCYLSFLDGDDARAAIECRTALSVDPGLAAALGTMASLERRGGRRVP